MNAPETPVAYRVRASSWGGLFDCAMRWEASNLLGMRGPVGIAAVLGTAIHASTAAFDQGRIDGAGFTPDDTAGLLVDRLRHPEDDIAHRDEDMTVDEAEKVGLILHSRYCTDWSPRFTFRAVEMETAPLDIDCGNGIIVRLTGTLDRARIYAESGGVGIKDVKSGGRAVEKGVAKTKGFAAQVGTYELLYEHTTGDAITEPGGIIGLKTSGKPEIAEGTISNAKRMMVGTDEQKGLIEYAAVMFKTGLFPPNPSTTLCSEKYCVRWATCHFHA
jgi:hypothetical protein